MCLSGSQGATTGRFSAHRAPDFRRWCGDFLRHQIETMQPRVVLILGVPACHEIAKVMTPSQWLRGALPAPDPSRPVSQVMTRSP